MFRTSISRLLIVLQSCLLIGLLAVTAVVAINAWRDYGAAREILDGTKTNRALFKAMIDVRAQIGKTQTALVSQDNPTGAVNDVRQRADAAFTVAMAEMRRLDLPGQSELVAELQSKWDKVKQLEEAIDRQAGLAKGDRDLAPTEPWRVAVHDTVNTISETSLTVGNQVRLLDPFVAEMIQVRRTAWVIRDRFGAQCSLLRPSVAASEPLSADMVGKWNLRIGGYEVSWRSMDELLARPGVPASVMNGVATAQQATQQVLERMQTLTAGFDGSGNPAMPAAEFTKLCNGPFDAIVGIAFSALDEAVAHAEGQLGGALAVVVVAGLAMLAALALSVFGVVMVIRRFTQPIGALMAVVGRLSQREFSEPVSSPRYPDELGQLSAALEDLRQNAQEAERLQAAQQAAEQRQLERGQRLEAAIGSFEQRVAEVVTAVQAASTEMQSNAQSLSAIAEEASKQSLSVAGASEQASANVKTVAVASEELSASIGEVNQRINGSSRMANEAVGEVERTNTSVEGLKSAAERIGDVVKLIQDIAEQTNLLALNATIEAARAGEAGKGFAVVAGEVKALATQTQKATEEISSQIVGMQSAAGGCVSAIDSIGKKILTINEALAAIAASAEQQAAATQEIARNVQQAAAGTGEVSSNIAGVTQAAGETGRMSNEVLEASSDLARQADVLGKEVDGFLDSVRAA